MTYLIVQEFFFPASFSRSPLPSSSSFRVGICRKHRKTKRVEGERTRERERERERERRQDKEEELKRVRKRVIRSE